MKEDFFKQVVKHERRGIKLSEEKAEWVAQLIIDNKELKF